MDSDFIVDIGIWKTKKAISLDDILANESDAEVLAGDIYVDGMTALQAAVLTMTEYLGTVTGNNAVDVDDRYKTVRVLAGVAIGEDPFKYFLGLKTIVDSATPVADGMIVEVEWVQG